MKNKAKKDIKFWKHYVDSSIGKGAKEEIKSIERKYNKHRAKDKRGEE